MKATSLAIALAAGILAFAPGAHAQGMPRSSAASSNPGANGAPTLGLRRFDFPDGTGSIGLAPGWQTNARTATRGMAIVGPAGARILIRNVFSVLMPNNPVPPTLAGRILVAPPSNPVNALAVLGPQLSRMSVAGGGPQMTFDNFVQRANAPSSMPQGSAAIVTFGVTETTRRGGPQHYLSLARIETAPSTRGSWMMQMTESRAPDATFERDLPTMKAMVSSLRINAAASRQATSRRVAQIKQKNQLADERRADILRTSDGYQKNNDDAVEVLRGTTTIEDTNTGERAGVNLDDSSAIVDGLNKGDPNRYRQIRLRDQ
jgi:hypothetical protein